MTKVIRRLDIHEYERHYASIERHVREAAVSSRNKAFIFAYRDACLLHQTCEKVRLIRVLGELLFFAKLVQKDFDQLSRQDLERLVAALLERQPSYTAETLQTKKVILKRFITWL